MGIWDKFYERAQSFFKESGAAGGSTEPKSRCYYDLLEVSREATDDEIKRSFKRLALQWHPDKNPDRAEECTAYFVLIQQAYEVLLDPQERAFYDRHRENIIYQQQQTTDSPGGVERRDTGIILEPYMTTSCFRQGGGSGVATGFVGGLFSAAMSATSPRNVDIELSEEEQEQFFTVYRDLFHKLAAEEYAYIEEPEERNFPVFGKATSDYDTVVAPFYGFWLDFTTQRSFAWLDKWDLRQAPDRPTARAMEKENRKSREQGRKQRSEQVRKVVEFVRRYDVRVQRAKELQRERNARIHQIVEEQRRQTIRRNLENMPTFERDEEAHRQHLAHLEEIEQALDAEFGTIDGAAADDDEAEAAADGGGHGTSGGDENSANVGRSGGGGAANKFRCIVCEKNFNTKNVLVSHQRSKKHRQMVELLRAHMRTEDQQLFFAGGEGAAAAEESGRTKNDGRGGAETDEDEESESSDHQPAEQKRGKKKRQRKQQRKEAAAARRLEEEERERQRQDGEEQTQREESGGGDERARCVAAEEKENNSGGREGEGDEIAAAAEEAESGKITVKKEAETAKKRKKGKRTDEQQRKTTAEAGGHEEQSKGPVHCECTSCGAEFESKTKLHAHLRDSGHATLKTVADKIGAAAADSATDSGGRRRRKKK
ncbi:hypothetical protein niasHT_037847 [Heterodera trifolii]|uniref:Uncharacterized protein n=1 Tax=Heterodera trifolii TaxID=157864 RepID=A0ABD2IQ93_9BILA